LSTSRDRTGWPFSKAANGGRKQPAESGQEQPGNGERGQHHQFVTERPGQFWRTLGHRCRRARARAFDHGSRRSPRITRSAVSWGDLGARRHPAMPRSARPGQVGASLIHRPPSAHWPPLRQRTSCPLTAQPTAPGHCLLAPGQARAEPAYRLALIAAEDRHVHPHGPGSASRCALRRGGGSSTPPGRETPSPAGHRQNGGPPGLRAQSADASSFASVRTPSPSKPSQALPNLRQKPHRSRRFSPARLPRAKVRACPHRPAAHKTAGQASPKQAAVARVASVLLQAGGHLGAAVSGLIQAFLPARIPRSRFAARLHGDHLRPALG